MLQMLARNWWILLDRGIAAVLFGIAIFLSPGIALTVLVLLWGAYAFTDGIFAIIAGFQGRQSHNNWWLTVLEGVIGVVAGVLTFIWPEITALTLLYIVAFWAIVTGVLEIGTAIQLRKEISGELWLGLSGIFSIIFGVVMIVLPGVGILSLLWLVAIYAIMFGGAMIILSFRVRNMADKSGQPRAPQAA